MYFNEHELSKFPIGAVVVYTSFNFPGKQEEIGHVAGFRLNSTGEVILLIQTTDEFPAEIHPSRVRLAQ